MTAAVGSGHLMAVCCSLLVHLHDTLSGELQYLIVTASASLPSTIALQADILPTLRCCLCWLSCSVAACDALPCGLALLRHTITKSVLACLCPAAEASCLLPELCGGVASAEWDSPAILWGISQVPCCRRSCGGHRSQWSRPASVDATWDLCAVGSSAGCSGCHCSTHWRPRLW